MIKSVSANPRFFTVEGGQSVTLPYINMSYASAGIVRYNGNNQMLEVYDGSTWLCIHTSTATLDLGVEAKETLMWAETKRQEEIKIKQFAEKYPAIRDAKEKLDILMTLVRE